MVRRIQIQSLIPALLSLNLILSGMVYGGASGALVQYSFDDRNIETGPDTFAVYKKSKGSVGLSTSFPYSGYHSVEIQDVVGDSDFPELQGYFPLQQSGTLFAHFALLVTNPEQPLNIALAGPEWFQVKKDGIAFWLLTKNGYLYHYSDSMPKKLFRLMPFTWYVVDLSYNIDQGRYDFTIRQEGQSAPLVDLSQQLNTSSNAHSSLDKFSFIGDLEDESGVIYYVDDVMIGSDKEIISRPFIAPGRHKLFFDYLQDYQKQVHANAICLPLSHMADIGLDDSRQYLLAAEGSMMTLLELLAGKEVALDGFEHGQPATFSFLSAVQQWQQGCSALAENSAAKASRHFRNAIALFDAPIYQLSYAMALAENDQYNEAVARLALQYGYWADDPRYAIAQAVVALSRKDWQSANRAIEPHAISAINNIDRPVLNALWAGQLDSELFAGFRKKPTELGEQALAEFIIAEQYFYLLLWSDRYGEALQYARAMTGYLAENNLPTTLWQTRIGDSLFIGQDYQAALKQYRQLLDQSIYRASLYKKISDIAFIQGDMQTEREYRELLYGTLQPR